MERYMIKEEDYLLKQSHTLAITGEIFHVYDGEKGIPFLIKYLI